MPGDALDGEPHARTVEATARLTDVRRSYIDQGVIGYLIYMVGAVTAFLAAALALSDGQAGLHSSALAVGMITASLFSHGLDLRFGVRISHFAALALCLAGGPAAGLGAGLSRCRSWALPASASAAACCWGTSTRRSRSVAACWPSSG